MVDIALDLGRGLQGDRFCANDARDFAAHHDLLTCNHAGDFATFTDDNLDGLHVAFDFTVNLKQTSPNDLEPLAHDLQIVADDRFVAAGRGAQVRLRPIRAVGASRAAFNCFGLECRVTLEHGIPQRCCWPHRCESCGQHMVELCRAELIQGLTWSADACGPHDARAILLA